MDKENHGPSRYSKEHSNAQSAIYLEQKIPEYQGVKYIEALPGIIEDPQDFIKLVSRIPKVTDIDRALSATNRMHLVPLKLSFYKPLSRHVELMGKISMLIRNGYVLRYSDERRKPIQVAGPDCYELDSATEPTVAELAVFGLSGIGKSTSLNNVLSLYPALICHTNYKGDRSVEYQIPCVKVDIPAQCRIKSLSLRILKRIDDLFGDDQYYKRGYDTSENNQTNLLSDVFDVNKLGLLVLDEIQNLRGLSPGLTGEMMRFFVDISNNIGVPIVLAGTPKAVPLFKEELQNGRRIADSPGMTELANDWEWELFMNTLFGMQLTQNPVDASRELMDVMYYESQGIIDIAIKIFACAQLRAISTGREKISKAIIKSVSSDTFTMVKPLINALRIGDERLLMKYEDLYVPPNVVSSFLTKENVQMENHEKTKGTQTAIESEKLRIKQEISDILTELGYDEELCEKISSDIVQTVKSGTSIGEMKRIAVLRANDTSFQKPKKKRTRSTPKQPDENEGLMKANAHAEESGQTREDVLSEQGYILDKVPFKE